MNRYINGFLKKEGTQLFLNSVINSYSQVFFSTDRLFAFLIMAVTFFDLYAGLYALLAVVTTQVFAFVLNLNKTVTSRGLYGFNSLLVALGLGLYFESGITLVFIIMLASLLTLFISVMLQGVLGKYALPYLSLPFILAFWIFFLATRHFPALGISDRGIYTFNDLYTIGGERLVRLYEYFNGITIVRSVKIYFISLSAILFQYNVLTGIILATGLLLFSRIAFTLSLLGFYTAYLFYMLVGAQITEADYSYIGFNYILTAIAAGGFFIIPSARSYFWVVLLIPLVAIITTSLSALFMVFGLPVYSLPFNIIVLLFLYVLKFRMKFSPRLSEVYVQHDAPERNLYAFRNHISRFRYDNYTPVKLPFIGTWHVSQGHDGEVTHRDRWRHAWDFVILDREGQQFRNEGNLPEDYFCYNKPVTAAADGEVAEVMTGIADNDIGEVNLKDNWGNTVILKHEEGLYSKVSHLKQGSITIKKGDKVKRGQVIGRCGNSGRSPYPHLHFQLQPFPYIGSETLDHPLAHYVLHDHGLGQVHGLDQGQDHRLDQGHGQDGGGPVFRSHASPNKGDAVSNIESNDLMKQAFNLVPGQEMCFEVNDEKGSRRTTWEVKVNAFNKTYIACTESGAVAWFENDGDLFYFTHYEGRRHTLLYYFYLGLYKTQTGFYKGMTMRDSYPLNVTQPKGLLWLQDFTAPFFFFLRSEYSITHYDTDDALSPSRIRLLASAGNTLFGRNTGRYDFILDITEKGIESVTVQTESKKTLLTQCTEITEKRS